MFEKIAQSFKPTISSSKIQQHLTANSFQRVKLLSNFHPFNSLEIIESRRRHSRKSSYNSHHRISILRIAPELVKKAINIDETSCSFDDSLSIDNIRRELNERLKFSQNNHRETKIIPSQSEINKQAVFVLNVPKTNITTTFINVESDEIPKTDFKIDRDKLREHLELIRKIILKAVESKPKEKQLTAVDENGSPVYIVEKEARQLYDEFVFDRDCEQILARQVVAQRAQILQELVLKKINETNKDGLKFSSNKALKKVIVFNN